MDNINSVYYSLSNQDIINWFTARGLAAPTIVQYRDFYKACYYGLTYPCFILYEWNPGFGHWTVLFKRNDGLLEFFDSFGKTVDYHLDKTFYETVKASDSIKKYIIETSRRSGNNIVEINDIQYQSPNSSTCGKWCIVKYYLTVVRPLGLTEVETNREFEDIFNSGNLEENDRRVNKVFIGLIDWA